MYEARFFLQYQYFSFWNLRVARRVSSYCMHMPSLNHMRLGMAAHHGPGKIEGRAVPYAYIWASHMRVGQVICPIHVWDAPYAYGAKHSSDHLP